MVAILFEHVYVSTACQHAVHERCRRACKFCGTECCCPCHLETTNKLLEETKPESLVGWGDTREKSE